MCVFSPTTEIKKEGGGRNVFIQVLILKSGTSIDTL